MSAGDIVRAREEAIHISACPLFYVIPEQTAQVAGAAFPKGNSYIRMRDALGPIYVNAEFDPLFPNDVRKRPLYNYDGLRDLLGSM
jgi:hypothetical protein